MGLDENFEILIVTHRSESKLKCEDSKQTKKMAEAKSIRLKRGKLKPPKVNYSFKCFFILYNFTGWGSG